MRKMAIPKCLQLFAPLLCKVVNPSLLQGTLVPKLTLGGHFKHWVLEMGQLLVLELISPVLYNQLENY